MLLYGTAGVEFKHINASINCTAAGACGANSIPPVAASSSTTKAGFIYDGGIDSLPTELASRPPSRNPQATNA